MNSPDPLRQLGDLLAKDLLRVEVLDVLLFRLVCRTATAATLHVEHKSVRTCKERRGRPRDGELWEQMTHRWCRFGSRRARFAVLGGVEGVNVRLRARRADVATARTQVRDGTRTVGTELAFLFGGMLTYASHLLHQTERSLNDVKMQWSPFVWAQCSCMWLLTYLKQQNPA